MESRIQEVFGQEGLLHSGDHVLAAVSGGVDSMCMMALLDRLRDRGEFRLTVAHLNHRLRPDAAEDAAFVQSRAEARGLDCRIGCEDVGAQAKAAGISLEMAARRARYRFLAQTARRAGANVTATGHTLDDQAETVLLRLGRGSGSSGLAAIRPRSRYPGGRLIRPLLGCTRDEVTAWMTKAGEAWRDDPSNLDERFLRNRVRSHVLPMMEAQLNPSAREALARSAAILSAEDRWLDAQARRRLRRCLDPESGTLVVPILRRAPLALRRRMVLLWLVGQGADPARLDFRLLARVEPLLASGHPPASVPVPGLGMLMLSYDRLAMGVPDGPGSDVLWPLTVPGATSIPVLDARVTVEAGRGYRPAEGPGVGALPAACWIDRRAVDGRPLGVRTWRDGDRIAPGGLAGTVKLQDVWVDHKVPRWRRRRVPLLLCGDEVVWVPGYRVAAAYHVRDVGAASWHVRIEPLTPSTDIRSVSGCIADGSRVASSPASGENV